MRIATRSVVVAKGVVLPEIPAPPGYAVAEEGYQFRKASNGTVLFVQGGLRFASLTDSSQIVVTLHGLQPATTVDIVAGLGKTWHSAANPHADVVVRA